MDSSWFAYTFFLLSPIYGVAITLFGSPAVGYFFRQTQRLIKRRNGGLAFLHFIYGLLILIGIIGYVLANIDYYNGEVLIAIPLLMILGAFGFVLIPSLG